jgi:hypothetical protein
MHPETADMANSNNSFYDGRGLYPGSSQSPEVDAWGAVPSILAGMMPGALSFFISKHRMARGITLG